MEEKKIPTLKISIIGDSSIGKSCLIYRYIENFFDTYSLPTVGIDFYTKRIIVDDENYKLHIFDLAGQERFRSIVTSYYRQNHGIILAFDITNKESFDNLKRWVVEIDKYSDLNVSIILVGTKLDLKSKREISVEQASEYAKCLRVNYHEISSKDNINIDKVFIDITRQIKLYFDREKYKNLEKERIIKLQKSGKKLKYCC